MELDFIKHTTIARFDTDVLKSKGAVLVVFSSKKYCVACVSLRLSMKAVAASYLGKVAVVFLEFEEPYPEYVPDTFDLDHLPTLKLYENGKFKAVHLYGFREPDIAAFLDVYL